MLVRGLMPATAAAVRARRGASRREQSRREAAVRCTAGSAMPRKLAFYFGSVIGTACCWLLIRDEVIAVRFFCPPPLHAF